MPYVGAGVLASSLCMDKVVFKEVLAAAAVPQVPYAGVRLRAGARARAVRRELAVLGKPVFVKPARLGSSVGIAKVWSEAELGPALDGAFAHDSLVIVEGFSAGHRGRVLGDRHRRAGGLGPGRDRATGADWYDYEAKYSRAGWSSSCRPGSPAGPARRCAGWPWTRSCGWAARAWRGWTSSSRTASGARQRAQHAARVHATSVFPKLWEARGLPFPALVRPAARASRWSAYERRAVGRAEPLGGDFLEQPDLRDLGASCLRPAS